jgi:anthranilate synthase/aminodeoxychorismate synthase-like glutamine amidotransferase
VRVLMVDNYDSFTYNLVQYLGELGAEPVAVRNDAAEVDDLLGEGFDRVVVSPGPCTPNEAGMSVEVMRRFPEVGVPALGVCLGHQSLVQAFGGRVVRHVPVHGKATVIEHDGSGLFAGLPQPLTVGRYHSLIADPDLPEALEATARGDGVVMAVRHRELPAVGVQFHPESVLTPDGKRLLENFLGDPH